MAKKVTVVDNTAELCEHEVYVTYEIMRSCKPVPASRPADFLTLTPVVIPMPIMPYVANRPPVARPVAPQPEVKGKK